MSRIPPASKFTELGLNPELVRAVAELGYVEPTPIQAQAIPAALQGQDVLGGAQTGTGKTAAFALPILQRLQPFANTSFSPARHPIRALILAPTRELAVQVEESLREYGKYALLKSTAVYGGVDIEPQLEVLRKGVEILVATPGRLLDHVQQRSVNLSTAHVLVLDEADRMLDMGFMPDVRRILALLPAKRQNLLFSATFPAEVKKLADAILQDPLFVQVTPRNSAAELVRQVAYMTAAERKLELLERLLGARRSSQVLVFLNTKQGAARLARNLERAGFRATAIHSDKTQGERMAALSAFKSGEANILVATDIAARGLDIEELPLVINFDLPRGAEDYIHRIGRTGRAGVSGDAISLVSPAEERRLADVERLLKRKIERAQPPVASIEKEGADPRGAVESAIGVRAGIARMASKKAGPGYLLRPGQAQEHKHAAAAPKIAALLGGHKKHPKPA